MDKKQKNYCLVCDRKYSSRQSYYNHKNRYHTIKDDIFPHFSTLNTTQIQPQNQQKTTLFQQKTTQKQHMCKYCNMTFSFSQSKYRHQKICKQRDDIITKLNNGKYISKKEHDRELKKELEKLKKMLTRKFMKLIKKECKANAKTMQNIGNQLNDHATQNNITIISLGKEDVLGTITEKEKIGILNERLMSVFELAKLMHCSDKYPQFNNSIISNLKSDYALTYNDEENRYVTTNKDDLVSDIVSCRTSDVGDMLEENKEKVNKTTNARVGKLLDMFNNEDNKNTEYVENYNKKVMTAVYDERNRLKKQMKEISV